jgi:steroid delta-isomerase-like uncharacterized protein
MSEKNNEALVRRLFDEVWNKGNVKPLDEMLTTDCVRHDPVDPGRGIESARSTVRKYRTAFPDCRLDIEEVMSIGDRVIARWRYSGTQRAPLEGIPATGKHVSGSGISIYRFAGDKIQEEFTDWDALGLMQQLGVVTMPGKTSTAGR